MPRSKEGKKRKLPPKEHLLAAAREMFEGASCRKVAEKYGVSKSAVAKIVKNWKEEKEVVGEYQSRLDYKKVAYIFSFLKT
jgi:transposase